jgi:uncharacterized protein YkwD
VATTLLTLALSLAAAPAQAQTPSRYEHQARVATNQKRDNHDLHKVRRGACVQRFAERQARRMAHQETLSHQDLGRVLRRCNLSTVGENVAGGYATGQDAVEGWMDSLGHRYNILNPPYRLLGLAVRRADDGTMYAVQVFGAR